jgi:hypothetical protein
MAINDCCDEKGDPINFKDEEMKAGDFFVSLCAHVGEGVVLERLIDPSLTDERNVSLSSFFFCKDYFI